MERDCYDNLCHRVRNATTKYRLYSKSMYKAIAILPIGRTSQAVLVGLTAMIDETIHEIQDAVNECAERRKQREPSTDA